MSSDARKARKLQEKAKKKGAQIEEWNPYRSDRQAVSRTNKPRAVKTEREYTYERMKKDVD